MSVDPPNIEQRAREAFDDLAFVVDRRLETAHQHPVGMLRRAVEGPTDHHHAADTSIEGWAA